MIDPNDPNAKFPTTYKKGVFDWDMENKTFDKSKTLPPPQSQISLSNFPSKSQEDLISTANIRKSANEYLKLNQNKTSKKYDLAPEEVRWGPESLDSQPRTFIVSRDSTLPPASSDGTTPTTEEATTQDTPADTAEAAKQRGSNEDLGRENNTTFPGSDNDEYVLVLVPEEVKEETKAGDTSHQVSSHCKLPADEPIRKDHGRHDAEQSGNEIQPGDIPAELMQLYNNTAKIPGDGMCGNALETELHISDRGLHQQPSGCIHRSDEAKCRGLEPIYESLATASESRSPGQASGASGQAREACSPPGGQSSPGRRRRYWPEEDLCSPLTRQQRQAVGKGLSLPVGRPAASLFEKSFSLGGYYEADREAQPSRLSYLKSSGRRLLHRLTSVRRNIKHKQPILFPPPQEPNDEDRVFFRGFSAVSKGSPGVHRTDLLRATSEEIPATPDPPCVSQVSTAPRRLLAGGGSRIEGSPPPGSDAASVSMMPSGSPKQWKEVSAGACNPPPSCFLTHALTR